MTELVCRHEKRRLDILSDLQNLGMDKADLQIEIDQIDIYLADAKEKLEKKPDLNYFYKLEVEKLQKELKEEVEYLEYMMDGLESKDREHNEMYDKIKKEAIEEKCSCLHNSIL